MKLEQQLLINMEWSSNKQLLMKLEQQLLINRNEVRTITIDWNEVRTKTIDQQGMKLEQQLLTYREWS